MDRQHHVAQHANWYRCCKDQASAEKKLEQLTAVINGQVMLNGYTSNGVLYAW